jgi:hypothetical protein
MDPETGRIKLEWELIAGGMAGGCQVVCGQSITFERKGSTLCTGVHESS